MPQAEVIKLPKEAGQGREEPREEINDLKINNPRKSQANVGEPLRGQRVAPREEDLSWKTRQANKVNPWRTKSSPQRGRTEALYHQGRSDVK